MQAVSSGLLELFLNLKPVQAHAVDSCNPLRRHEVPDHGGVLSQELRSSMAQEREREEL